MRLTRAQETALKYHCRLAAETTNPRYRALLPVGASRIITVNSGYEWIDEGFGGPVWHCSTAPQLRAFTSTELKQLCVEGLDDVGDSQLGEWWEVSRRAVHLRRRLSMTEQVLIGEAIDIRADADEVARRLKPVRHIVGWDWREWFWEKEWDAVGCGEAGGSTGAGAAAQQGQTTTPARHSG